MRKLITNCPNCGGALESNGRCPFCGTHVRFANELDLQVGNFSRSEPIEILLTMQLGDQTIIYPLIGAINNITIDHVMYSAPVVKINFVGECVDIGNLKG